MPVMYVFITGALYHEGACDATAKLPIKLDGLKALDGSGFGIAIDEAAGTAIFVLLDVPRAEGKSKIELTHPASTAYHWMK